MYITINTIKRLNYFVIYSTILTCFVLRNKYEQTLEMTLES